MSPNTPAIVTMQKCARPSCSKVFPARSNKKWCGHTCSEWNRNKRHTAAHPKSQLARTERWRATHPEAMTRIKARAAEYTTEVRRGTTRVEFEQRVAAQGNRCPIGNHLFSSERGNGRDCPARDHSHRTGQNRAILCNRHNLGLGIFRDSIPELAAAMIYLQKWETTA